MAFCALYVIISPSFSRLSRSGSPLGWAKSTWIRETSPWELVGPTRSLQPLSSTAFSTESSIAANWTWPKFRPREILISAIFPQLEKISSRCFSVQWSGRLPMNTVSQLAGFSRFLGLGSKGERGMRMADPCTSAPGSSGRSRRARE